MKKEKLLILSLLLSGFPSQQAEAWGWNDIKNKVSVLKNYFSREDESNALQNEVDQATKSFDDTESLDLTEGSETSDIDGSETSESEEKLDFNDIEEANEPSNTDSNVQVIGDQKINESAEVPLDLDPLFSQDSTGTDNVNSPQEKGENGDEKDAIIDKIAPDKGNLRAYLRGAAAVTVLTVYLLSVFQPEAFQQFVNWISNQAPDVDFREKASAMLSGITNSLGEGFSSLVEGASGLYNTAASSLSQLGSGVSELASGLYGKAGSALSGLGSGVSELASGLYGKAGSALSGLVSSSTPGVKSALESLHKASKEYNLPGLSSVVAGAAAYDAGKNALRGVYNLGKYTGKAVGNAGKAAFNKGAAFFGKINPFKSRQQMSAMIEDNQSLGNEDPQIIMERGSPFVVNHHKGTANYEEALKKYKNGNSSYFVPNATL